jgi:hypothetical protein
MPDGYRSATPQVSAVDDQFGTHKSELACKPDTAVTSDVFVL